MNRALLTPFPGKKSALGCSARDEAGQVSSGSQSRAHRGSGLVSGAKRRCRQALALEIDDALRAITEAPLRWPLGRRGERRFVLDRFPYTVLYFVRADHVFVVAIAHQSRRPGYWGHRK
ncbi:MAG: type II toxin-antitoxin system RelE/ParE family toxin [Thermoanaerobaculia bacterium]